MRQRIPLCLQFNEGAMIASTKTKPASSPSVVISFDVLTKHVGDLIEMYCNSQGVAVLLYDYRGNMGPQEGTYHYDLVVEKPRKVGWLKRLFSIQPKDQYLTGKVYMHPEYPWRIEVFGREGLDFYAGLAREIEETFKAKTPLVLQSENIQKFR